MRAVRFITLFVQTLFVLFYLFFEELVWERLIVPIRLWLERSIGVAFQERVQRLSASWALFLFVSILAVAEGFGLAAAPVALLVHPLLGALFYLLKILFAALSFWIFARTKERLLEVGWFALVYTKTLALYERVKATWLYKEVKAHISALKALVRNYLRRLPKGELRRIYTTLKSLLRR